MNAYYTDGCGQNLEAQVTSSNKHWFAKNKHRSLRKLYEGTPKKKPRTSVFRFVRWNGCEDSRCSVAGQQCPPFLRNQKVVSTKELTGNTKTGFYHDGEALFRITELLDENKAIY